MFNTVPGRDRQTNGHTCNTVNSGVARGQDKDECSQSDLKKNLGAHNKVCFNSSY